jgi:endonuclease/exonuclease/phosphatase (EEP) superfamily protein YafD
MGDFCQITSRCLTLVLAAVTTGALLAGCAAVGEGPTWLADPQASRLLASDERGIEACRADLQARNSDPGNGLDTDNIRLVNWNIKKKSIPNWRQDYARLTSGKDLILIQEASLRADTIADLPSVPYWSFAPGYRTSDAITGVLTLSSVEPMTRCTFVTKEPLLRTPKATSITQFGLKGRSDTLLVVNVHAVNFSFGLGSYKRQFEQIAAVLEDHKGPVILSGDLNTWREGRQDTVAALASTYNLDELAFPDDRRTLVFGRPLDHIYVRGLSATTTQCAVVTSSDHNPLSVSLSM